MGVSSWGENPLYENLRVSIIMDTTKSISRRQGRFREKSSEGSRSANVRAPSADGIVHRKLTFLSGESCLPSDRTVMREIRKRFTRLTKRTRHIRLLLGGYESKRETQNRQQLVNTPVAPCMATYRVSKQKSAEGHLTEGSNAGMSVAIP